jgi:threonine dehydrogenase-like Zn-dependent dehydrogenase
MENAIHFAGNASTVMMFGLTHPDCAIDLHPFYIFQHEITVKASFINPYTISRAVSLLDSGKLKVNDLITDVIPIEDCVKVFTDSSYRSHGKIIVRP